MNILPFAFALPGGFEWIVILLVALLLFGKKLPSIMRGLGGSMREFKKGAEEGAEVSKQAQSALEDSASTKP